jgi:DNA-binding transcriptional MerR regulator
MNYKRSDLQTIKIFSSSTGLSLKALRLYDQLDILKPIHVDSASGYRYYHVEQLHKARLIRMMRLMNMPLTLIRQVLTASPSEAEQLVLAYWQDLQASLELAGHVVQTLIQTLKGEGTPMAIEVQVKTVEKQTILSVTHHVKVNQLEKTIHENVKKLQQVAQAKKAKAGVPFGIYHGAIDHESDGPIEICLPIEKALTDAGAGIQLRELDGAKVAYVELRGDECIFPEILKGYDAIYDWMRQNGYEQSESPREIWFGQNVPEHIEVQWAFQEKNS